MCVALVSSSIFFHIGVFLCISFCGKRGSFSWLLNKWERGGELW